MDGAQGPRRPQPGRRVRPRCGRVCRLRAREGRSWGACAPSPTDLSGCPWSAAACWTATATTSGSSSSPGSRSPRTARYDARGPAHEGRDTSGRTVTARRTSCSTPTPTARWPRAALHQDGVRAADPSVSRSRLPLEAVRGHVRARHRGGQARLAQSAAEPAATSSRRTTNASITRCRRGPFGRCRAPRRRSVSRAAELTGLSGVGL